MTKKIVTEDYYNPSLINGHGEHQYLVWCCTQCDHTQPIIQEEDD